MQGQTAATATSTEVGSGAVAFPVEQAANSITAPAPAYPRHAWCSVRPRSGALTERIHAVRAGRPAVIWMHAILARPDGIQFYSPAAVFCCPSVSEPFGITNLEAMACQTAVVASAVGGIKESVKTPRWCRSLIFLLSQ